MPIHQLPPEVAAKIAAGEVVERPASVVKELLENALDAGAQTIRLELAGGGLDLIRVSDDGRGIAAADMPLALARHATSKISALDDLERITTLGFRGEALASIAAVAQVTLLSRPATAASGRQLIAGDGVAGPIRAAGAPVGTSISVRGLFRAVPARLKFLKTRATETGHCLHLVEQYALAYPEVRFFVMSDGRQVLATAGDGRLASVLVAVYGVRVADAMLPLAVENAAERSATGPASMVWGAISRPTCYKSTRQYLSFFVNRRWVQSRSLTYAVEEAYHSLLLAGRHPIAVVNIALDPALLDVNVHPAKTEVRFLRERQVYAAVQGAARAALLATIETPRLSPGAFAAPGWASEHAPTGLAAPADSAPRALQAADTSSQARLWAPGYEAVGTAHDADVGSALADGGTEELVGGRKLPALRVLGQVSQSYIITEGPDGMYLVDQHAAHERILLERMITEWRAREVASQLLLQPLTLELGPDECELIEVHLVPLAAIGFQIEPFGIGAMLLRAVPAVLASQPHPQPLRELVLELAGAGDAAASHGETWEEHALANVACKAAIKAGQTLSPDEQRELIRQLEGAAAYQSCCHGRPTMVHLSLSALEREFDRR